jgi:hypothetical protein
MYSTDLIITYTIYKLGEACSHIGALLFLIAEQVASGKNLPDDLSATDQLCAWKDPKSKCNAD